MSIKYASDGYAVSDITSISVEHKDGKRLGLRFVRGPDEIGVELLAVRCRKEKLLPIGQVVGGEIAGLRYGCPSIGRKCAWVDEFTKATSIHINLIVGSFFSRILHTFVSSITDHSRMLLWQKWQRLVSEDTKSN